MNTIPLYKFKSLNPINFVLDIIFNKRLYCSDWKSLNDPMEGLFRYRPNNPNNEDPEQNNRRLESIESVKNINKICALSKEATSPLLWAHYADSFKGIAIEVQVFESDIEHVTYEEEPPLIEPWSYEKEARIITNQTYYYPHKISRIIMGPKTPDEEKKMLESVCNSKNISVTRAEINDHIIRIPSN